MTYYSLLEPEPDKSFDLAPIEVRQALMRMQRTARALRLYFRRGWNLSAVAAEHRRARAEFDAAVSRWEFDEMNPSLF